MGALYFIEEYNPLEEEIEVQDFIEAGQWNRQKPLTHISDEEIVNYIYDDIKPPTIEDGTDKAWWIVRNKRTQKDINN